MGCNAIEVKLDDKRVYEAALSVGHHLQLCIHVMRIIPKIHNGIIITKEAQRRSLEAGMTISGSKRDLVT